MDSNSTSSNSTMGCPPSGPICPPSMNTDVSGIGVRISFYLQALFLSLLSARSGSLDEITDSLYTLVATNMAMAVTSLILGFKENPEISLQDGLIVFYLLAMSWVAVFFSLPSYNRFIKSDNVLKYLSVFQSYLLFAFALAILVKGDSFGSSPECNSEALVVIFRPFSAIHGGRVVGWITVSIALLFYTFLTVSDYLPTAKKEWEKLRDFAIRLRNKKGKDANAVPSSPPGAPEKDNSTAIGSHGQDLEANQNRPRSSNMSGIPSSNISSAANPSSTTSEKPRRKKKKKSKSKSDNEEAENNKATFDLGISGTLIIEIAVILLLWSLAVMNTELLIRWNSFSPSDGSQWQFGQVLPMFLIVLPLINLVKAFKEYKLHRRSHRRKVHRNGKNRAQKNRHHSSGGASGSAPFGHAGSSPRRPGGGPGHSPFSFPGGRDPLADIFGGSFPFQSQQNPRGNLAGARISAHSIHSQHSVEEDEKSDSGSSESDTESLQEGPSSKPLRRKE
ncbi:hypothetical protein SCHPADRAFT_994226 [Schizopora paradoxa]|uniref:Uncharacterized protein n=1 Tax=Schizopora paradoxa TaxID=27342 RepID=A0A0H2S7B8_9AGAM|nr:hypothetical protein SCHPADRAFT_994226 [Schizopora paradoxa]